MDRVTEPVVDRSAPTGGLDPYESIEHGVGQRGSTTPKPKVQQSKSTTAREDRQREIIQRRQRARAALLKYDLGNEGSSPPEPEKGAKIHDQQNGQSLPTGYELLKDIANDIQWQTHLNTHADRAAMYMKQWIKATNWTKERSDNMRMAIEMAVQGVPTNLRSNIMQATANGHKRKYSRMPRWNLWKYKAHMSMEAMGHLMMDMANAEDKSDKEKVLQNISENID